MLAQFLFLFSGFLLVAVSQRVGDECMTKANELGECRQIQKCEVLYTLAREIANNSLPRDRFLPIIQKEACGVSQLVCCSLTVEDISTRSNSATFEHNPLLPDRNSCGFQSADRIIGGNDTSLTEFPWMAQLEYRHPNGGSSLKCGGFLINNRYVLTAAHCTRQSVMDRLTKVRLGEWDTSTDVDCPESNYCNLEPLEISLEQIIVHPDYIPNSRTQFNDIALLRMRQTVEFNEFVKPICLPMESDGYVSGSRGWVSGWGHTEHSRFSAKKQKVQVPIVANPYCKVFLQKFNKIESTQICAGGTRTQDSCGGDSGGPLMTTAANDSSQWYVKGIVSYGPKCGLYDYPAVYTRVSKYLKWIHENVRP